VLFDLRVVALARGRPCARGRAALGLGLWHGYAPFAGRRSRQLSIRGSRSAGTPYVRAYLAVLVVPTDEELEMAEQAAALVSKP
jgi:hypothetical protein